MNSLDAQEDALIEISRMQRDSYQDQMNAAVLAMRLREAKDAEYESMVQAHRKDRAARCARQRAW